MPDKTLTNLAVPAEREGMPAGPANSADEEPPVAVAAAAEELPADTALNGVKLRHAEGVRLI